MPDHPIPDDCKVKAHDAAIEYDLVWVRLDSSLDTRIPGCPAFADAAFRCVAGEPYTWPTSAARRLENFVDLAHFPFVHDGTLGDRRQTRVPIAKVDRLNRELRFQFVPSPEMQLPGVALMAPTDYRLWVPFTVNLEFFFPDGERSQLWMSASPLESGVCRSFWFTCRTADRDGADQPHLDFQALVLSEDLPVIEAQDPPEIPAPAEEYSVRTDKVSIAYRRWLKELSRAADDRRGGGGPAASIRYASSPTAPLTTCRLPLPLRRRSRAEADGERRVSRCGQESPSPRRRRQGASSSREGRSRSTESAASSSLPTTSAPMPSAPSARDMSKARKSNVRFTAAASTSAPVKRRARRPRRPSPPTR